MKKLLNIKMWFALVVVGLIVLYGYNYKSKIEKIRISGLTLGQKVNLTNNKAGWIKATSITNANCVQNLMAMAMIYKAYYDLDKPNIWCKSTLSDPEGDFRCIQIDANNIINKIFLFKSYGMTDIENPTTSLKNDYIKKVKEIKKEYGEVSCKEYDRTINTSISVITECVSTSSSPKIEVLLDVDRNGNGGDIVTIYSIESHKKIEKTNIDNTNITIIGNKMWQDEKYTKEEREEYSNFGKKNVTGIGKALKWKQAKLYCQNLTLGGFTDWYLPSIDEMIELSKQQAKLKNVLPDHFWSSSVLYPNMKNSTVWDIYMKNGKKYKANPFAIDYVRCVRNI